LVDYSLPEDIIAAFYYVPDVVYEMPLVDL